MCVQKNTAQRYFISLSEVDSSDKLKKRIFGICKIVYSYTVDVLYSLRPPTASRCCQPLVHTIICVAPDINGVSMSRE